MKLKSPVILKSVGLLASIVARFVRRTIDWHAIYMDARVDTVHPQALKRCVFACWHEYMLMPIVLRGHRRMLALASDHSDGEIITRAMQHLGWSVARGSTSRSGVKALLRMLHERDCSLNLTPDGPRGPRRQMSVGPIALASRLGLPLVCVGYAYHHPWRMRSWDQFAVPRPFSRCRAVFGPPIMLPSNLTRDQMEAYRSWFEELLNWLTSEAEAWAESGKPRTGSMPMRVKVTPFAMKGDSPPAYQLPLSLRQRYETIASAPLKPKHAA